MEASTSLQLVPLSQVREAVLSGYVPEYTDPEELAREFALRLLSAESPEELFSVTEAVKAEELVGEPFDLLDVQFLRSDFADMGLSVYALLRCRNQERGMFACTCGGQNVVVQCLRALEEGWLPRTVTVQEAGRHREGRNRPLYLVMTAEADTAKGKGK